MQINEQSIDSLNSSPAQAVSETTETSPGINAHRKTVAVHLIRSDEMPACSFWIGLFQKGSLRPNELFACNGLAELFEKAATEGVHEAEPIMLSDSVVAPARFVYLLPEPSHSQDRMNQWIQNLSQTLKSWSPAKIGIYLAPALVSQRLAQELIQDILMEGINQTSATDFFLQVTTHGLNSMLNTALRVKTESEGSGILTYVFH